MATYFSKMDDAPVNTDEKKILDNLKKLPLEEQASILRQSLCDGGNAPVQPVAVATKGDGRDREYVPVESVGFDGEKNDDTSGISSKSKSPKRPASGKKGSNDSLSYSADSKNLEFTRDLQYVLTLVDEKDLNELKKLFCGLLPAALTWTCTRIAKFIGAIEAIKTGCDAENQQDAAMDQEPAIGEASTLKYHAEMKSEVLSHFSEIAPNNMLYKQLQRVLWDAVSKTSSE